jgi:hypothetical protein
LIVPLSATVSDIQLDTLSPHFPTYVSGSHSHVTESLLSELLSRGEVHLPRHNL